MGWIEYEQYDGDLASVLRVRGNLTYAEMLGLLGQVLRTVVDLHAVGVIHR
jgi:serine/threonine protein kinase